MPALDPPRPCGGCEVCCVVLDVPDVSAPAGVPCRWLVGDGCALHRDRPELCRGFQCSWSLGDPAIPEDARPDRSGVLVWVDRTPAGLTVHVREVHAGGLSAGWVRNALDKWVQRVAVTVEDARGRRRLGLIGRGWQDV